MVMVSGHLAAKTLPHAKGRVGLFLVVSHAHSTTDHSTLLLQSLHSPSR